MVIKCNLNGSGDIINQSSLFGDLSSPIFKDRGVLDVGYIPSEIIERDQQIQAVVDLFIPIFSNGRPEHAIIYGATGSGKSVVVKFVLNQLLAEGHSQVNLRYIEVSCRKHNTITKVLSHILRAVGYPGRIPSRGLATGYYYDLLFDFLKHEGYSVTIIFDEIDFLKDIDIIYNFSRTGEYDDLNDRQYIQIIGLSNTGQFINMLDPRTESSFQHEHIIFNAYNKSQLEAILNARLALAFQPGVVEATTIELCAQNAEDAGGDARLAIKLLKMAGTNCIQTNCDTVQPGHITMATHTLSEDVSSEYIQGLVANDRFCFLGIYSG